MRIWVWRTRRLLPLLLVGAVALAVAHALAPPPPDSAQVLVLARDVAAGERLVAGDVRTARVPTALVPDGAVPGSEDAVGARAVVDLPRGMPVVEQVLATGRFAVEPPAGTVVVPLVLADATGLLRPGDRVDVLAAQDDLTGAAAEVLARAALVVDVEADPGPEPVLGGSAPVVGATLVAVSPEEGRRIAGRSPGVPLGAVLVT